MAGSETIAADLIDSVEAAVASGEYASPGDAVIDAVKLWRDHRAEYAERLVAIRSHLRRSLDAPGPDADEDEVERHLRDVHDRTMRAHRDAAIPGPL